MLEIARSRAVAGLWSAGLLISVVILGPIARAQPSESWVEVSDRALIDEAISEAIAADGQLDSFQAQIDGTFYYRGYDAHVQPAYDRTRPGSGDSIQRFTWSKSGDKERLDVEPIINGTPSAGASSSSIQCQEFLTEIDPLAKQILHYPPKPIRVVGNPRDAFRPYPFGSLAKFTRSNLVSQPRYWRSSDSVRSRLSWSVAPQAELIIDFERSSGYLPTRIELRDVFDPPVEGYTSKRTVIDLSYDTSQPLVPTQARYSYFQTLAGAEHCHRRIMYVVRRWRWGRTMDSTFDYEVPAGFTVVDYVNERLYVSNDAGSVNWQYFGKTNRLPWVVGVITAVSAVACFVMRYFKGRQSCAQC